MMNSLVIFDIGATFVFGPTQGPASRIAAEIGLNNDQKKRLELALMTCKWERSESVINFLYRDLKIEGAQVSEAVRNIWSAQENEATPIEGALPALERLVEAGFRIGIISNIWHPFLIAARKHFGTFIDKHVHPDHQIYSYRQGIAKPSELLFQRALTTAKVEPHNALMVGDSYREDIEPAARLGLRTIWLLHRPTREVIHLARTLNGGTPQPSYALVSIAELEPQLIRMLLARSSTSCASVPA